MIDIDILDDYINKTVETMAAKEEVDADKVYALANLITARAHIYENNHSFDRGLFSVKPQPQEGP